MVWDVVDKIAEVRYLTKYILNLLSHNGTLRFQVHPYAKMAWSILSAVPQVCRHHICHSDVLTGDPRADRLFLPSCTSTRVSVAFVQPWLMFTPSCLTLILSRARGRRIEPRHRRRLSRYSRLWRRRQLNVPILSVVMRRRGVFVCLSFVQQTLDLTISYIRDENDEASYI